MMENINNSNEEGDLNFVLRDFQYSALLDIPFHKKVLHQLYSFFGKINASISAPPFLGYFYFIVLIIQSFIPSFLVDCEDVWPKNSFMTLILYILGYLFNGPHYLIKSSRIILSLVISIIFIILFILLIIRANHYQKAGRASSSEAKFFYYTFKYIMPLLCPHIVAGMIISFDQIVSQNKINYNIVCIIFSIVSILFYFFLNYAIISPRVLLEDTPSHEWIPHLNVLSIIYTSCLSALSGIAGCIDGKKRIGCSIVALILSALFGTLFLLSSGIIKMKIGNIFSATFFGSTFASLFLTIALVLSKPLSPEILFVISIVVFILLIFAIFVLKNMQMNKTLVFLDSLMDYGSLAQEELQKRYSNPLKFLCEIHSVVETWHPLIANMEIFEFAVSQWPENFDILLFYSRILMIFPNKNHKLISISSKIASLPEKISHTSYLYQIRHFTRMRQTSVTPAFREKFKEINSQTEITMAVIKRFWENILQNNIRNFWSETDHVVSKVSELDSLYAQMIDDYTSNIQLLKSYGDFAQKIKHDNTEAQEISQKIENMKTNGINNSDLALTIAIQVFPNLNNYLNMEGNESNDGNVSDVSNYSQEEAKTISGDMNEKENEKNNDDQFSAILSNLIKHSKLGSIWIECVILVIATIITIVMFFFYYKCFIDKFTKKQENSLNLLIQINHMLNELSYFSVNLNIRPFFFEKQIVTSASFNNLTDFMIKVGPTLFTNGSIPKISLDSDKMVDSLSKVKHKFDQMTVIMQELDKKDPLIQQLNDVFYSNTNFSAPFKDMIMNQILIAQDLITYDTTEDFFRTNWLYSNFTVNNNIIIDQINSLASIAHQYCAYGYESSHESLKRMMSLTILFDLLLLTLPYLIQLLILFNQSKEIADSFVLFPKTEIRSIINKYGESSTNLEEGNDEQVSFITKIGTRNQFNDIIFFFNFIISFLGIIICSLIIFFTANDFIDQTESISNEVFVSTPPISSLSLSFIQIFRIHTLTHDSTMNQWGYPGYPHISDLTQNIYYLGNDNITDLVENLESILNVTKQKMLYGFFNDYGGMNELYQNQDKFYYFQDIFPDNTNNASYSKSFFEMLATSSFSEALDHISDIFNAFYDDFYYYYDYTKDKPYMMDYSLSLPFDEIPSLAYWFSEFAEGNRTEIYFKIIEDNALSRISNYKIIGDFAFYFVICWQIIACIFMLLYLLRKHTIIRRSLYFYNFFKPEVIIQNTKALNLIDSGRTSEEENNENSSNYESVFSKISQGMIIINKDFKITKLNNSLLELFHLNENVIGQKLDYIVQKDNQDKTWIQLINHIKSAITGGYKFSFSEDVAINLLNGSTSHLNCLVLCLTSTGIANENNFLKIENIALMFDDNLEVFMRKQQIENETNHLTEMFSNVMPSCMVNSFVNGGECISFIVQSVSIGSIRVKVMKHFDENTTEEFTFYNEIFRRFDDAIKDFELLVKLNTFSHTYTFIGGLFSEINKPERHAEESIKFALNLLKIVPEMSSQLGSEIQLTIGVHTGGPIVAGVMSFSKPTFQIIGTVSEMANQMKNKGTPGTICISRAVYELIFSAGFNVQEQGDTQIRGGKIIPTYLVRV